MAETSASSSVPRPILSIVTVSPASTQTAPSASAPELYPKLVDLYPVSPPLHTAKDRSTAYVWRNRLLPTIYAEPVPVLTVTSVNRDVIRDEAPDEVYLGAGFADSGHDENIFDDFRDWWVRKYPAERVFGEDEAQCDAAFQEMWRSSATAALIALDDAELGRTVVVQPWAVTQMTLSEDVDSSPLIRVKSFGCSTQLLNPEEQTKTTDPEKQYRFKVLRCHDRNEYYSTEVPTGWVEPDVPVKVFAKIPPIWFAVAPLRTTEDAAPQDTAEDDGEANSLQIAEMSLEESEAKAQNLCNPTCRGTQRPPSLLRTKRRPNPPLKKDACHPYLQPWFRGGTVPARLHVPVLLDLSELIPQEVSRKEFISSWCLSIHDKIPPADSRTMSSTTASDEQYPYVLLSDRRVRYEYATYVGQLRRPPPPPPEPVPEDHRLPDASCIMGPPPDPPNYVAIPVDGARWCRRVLLDENDLSAKPKMELTVEPYLMSSEWTPVFQRGDAPLVKPSIELSWAEDLKKTWWNSLMPGEDIEGLDREMICDALWKRMVPSAEERSISLNRNLRIRAVARPPLTTTTQDGRVTTVELGYSTQPLGTEAPNTLPETILHQITFRSGPANSTTAKTWSVNPAEITQALTELMADLTSREAGGLAKDGSARRSFRRIDEEGILGS
ncbi:uncharacterized protein MKK02DRAFT_31065 [Dioszegia hungarica]|uniref:Uncharacterized protein n=1 Tax=Dioszegia hungarica TaxID=4972 RepID=A0AA38HGW8_9TREE|nr:uncharacterized protein MKK02DRAFT_31065 [Dioszegia hungarica]KAI9638739.1 hypothetical protein MKK02DRAFT_31065 [Dioszegia hungarica]